jgi:hypothetical protein
MGVGNDPAPANVVSSDRGMERIGQGAASILKSAGGVRLEVVLKEDRAGANRAAEYQGNGQNHNDTVLARAHDSTPVTKSVNWK